MSLSDSDKTMHVIVSVIALGVLSSLAILGWFVMLAFGFAHDYLSETIPALNYGYSVLVGFFGIILLGWLGKVSV